MLIRAQFVSYFTLGADPANTSTVRLAVVLAPSSSIAVSTIVYRSGSDGVGSAVVAGMNRKLLKLPGVSGGSWKVASSRRDTVQL